ncbi:glycerophosphoryl diester phosphodiesterase [Sporosarcina luteola]|nr:glycerophosphoryl diester phosphodiesterase [Sporosarcina luteola]
MKKKCIFIFLFLLFGCEQTEKSTLPKLPVDDFLIIAHRGASAYAPEHTLASYELAVQMGADYIELDLQRTKDGELVVMHDKFIMDEETKIAVSDLTLDQINAYRTGNFKRKRPVSGEGIDTNERIVSLREVFERFGTDVNYYIELKAPDDNPGMEKELLQQLKEFGIRNEQTTLPSIILQSFDQKSLQRIHNMEPSIPLIQLYSSTKTPSFTEKEFKRLNRYASGVGINKDVVTNDLIDQFHEHGLDVHPFTVNDEEEMDRLLQWGADGIFTDRPDVGVELKRREQ